MTSIHTDTETDWLIRFSSSADANLRLFCFPFAGGDAQTYHGWPTRLPASVDLCAVQPPGRGSRLSEAPFEGLHPLVKTAREALRPYLDRPFAVFGHSLGALLGFEWIRELRREGLRQPCHLFVSGHIAPHLNDPNPELFTLPDDELIEKLRSYGGIPEAILESEEMMELFTPVMRADLKVLETYQYQREPLLSCAITAFSGNDDPRVPSRAHLNAWSKHTRADFASHYFPGGHFYFDDHLKALLEVISEALSPKLDP